MACMIGMLYRVKVVNTVYSEWLLACAVIAECLLVSSSPSDFSPYVSFMSRTLANHSYLDLSLVGSDNADGFQCHTDLAIMFAVVFRVSIVDTGSYFSNENRLTLAGDNFIVLVKLLQLRELQHGAGKTGIYHCSTHLSVFVGLYTGSGSILWN